MYNFSSLFGIQIFYSCATYDSGGIDRGLLLWGVGGGGTSPGGDCLGGGRLSWGAKVRGLLSWGAIVLGGYCHGGAKVRGSIVWGQLSWAGGVIVMGG